MWKRSISLHGKHWLQGNILLGIYLKLNSDWLQIKEAPEGNESSSRVVWFQKQSSCLSWLSDMKSCGFRAGYNQGSRSTEHSQVWWSGNEAVGLWLSAAMPSGGSASPSKRRPRPDRDLETETISGVNFRWKRRRETELGVKGPGHQTHRWHVTCQGQNLVLKPRPQTWGFHTWASKPNISIKSGVISGSVDSVRVYWR